MITPKSAPGAKYRYIYYPDRLNLLPSSSESLTLASMSKLYNSGIIDGIWHSLLEPLVAGREDNVHDESIGDFISRRVDPRVADNIVSAVFHGIYAGDIYQLSARTLLNKAWQLEGSRWSSVIIAYMDAYGRSEQDPISLWQPHEMSMIEAMLGKDQDRPGEINVDSQLLEKCRPSECATLSFKGGMQQLVDTLAASLQRNKNVSLATHTMAISVQKVKPDSNAPFSSPAIKIDSVPTAAPSPDIELKHTKASAHTFDFVIDTQGLSDPGRNTAPLLAPAVTVMTVNLWYAQPKLCPVPGFGYLIPRSVPLAQNPERALGVIFDHDMNHGQDSGRGTKLTVMIGGHWWDGFEPEDLPTEDDGREMAMAVVRRHLGIEEVPDVCRVRVNRECIPQYTVGYEERLQALDSRVSGEFGGRVRLVGNRVDGVGVNDCVRGAWHLASRMKRNGWRSEKNGLEVRGGATKGKPKLLTYHTSGKLWRLAEKGKGLEGKAVEV